ncbi:MAG: hypothetical protein SH859_16945 [Hyphomicrobium aestuarii]|nr:hypothetical protein [Hyphomicrobium aestuarii]
MSAERVRAQLHKLASHPVTFLLAINVACAALGLVQFAYTLTILKPADFALIGVLAAIGGVVTGLLDVKLADLTTSLYYAAPKENSRRRADILSSSLALHLAAGVVVALLVMAVSAIVAPRLLEQGADPWFVAAMALRMAVVFPNAALTTFLRLVGDFAISGWLRLATQIAVTLITLACLVASPDLGGFFAGVALAGAVSIGLAMVVAARVVSGALAHSILTVPPGAMVRQILTEGRFLVGASLVGLSKMLSRSADTLLVAALTNDTVTGYYRVARQAYDTMAGLSDAVHQFYTPTIVDCIKREQWGEFRRHRWRLMAIGTAAAIGTVLASWFVLRPLAAAHYPHYAPTLPAFEVFSGLLVVTLGIHGWLWPSLVAADTLKRFGLLGILGALSQLAAIGLLVQFTILDATTAAMTAWIMAMVNYGPFLTERLGQRLRSSS